MVEGPSIPSPCHIYHINILIHTHIHTQDIDENAATATPEGSPRVGEGLELSPPSPVSPPQPPSPTTLSSLRKETLDLRSHMPRKHENECVSMFNVPSFDEFLTDFKTLRNTIHSGPVTSYSFKQLEYLASKFQLHCLLNSTRELDAQKSVPHRDFYNIRKVRGWVSGLYIYVYIYSGWVYRCILI